MFCTNCGSPVPDNAKFCTNCGAPLSLQTPAQEMPEEAQAAESFEDMKARAAEGFADFRDRASESFSNLKEKTSEGLSQASEKASVVYQEARENAQQAAHSVNSEVSAMARDFRAATGRPDTPDGIGANAGGAAGFAAGMAGATGAGFAADHAGAGGAAPESSEGYAGGAAGTGYAAGGAASAGNGGYNGAAYPLQTDRSLAAYIVLSLITCGIYGFYFVFSVARDMNEAIDDGEKTPGLGIYLLLSILTCGLYSLYWEYKLGNRLANAGPQYGVAIPENGTSILLWRILGGFICYFGTFVGVHILIKNVNLICAAYNRQHFGE